MVLAWYVTYAYATGVHSLIFIHEMFSFRLKKNHVFLTTYTSLKQCENTEVEKAKHLKKKIPIFAAAER